jgi:hypothetical protein
MALLLPTSNDGLGDFADAFRGDSETLRSAHSPGSRRSQGRQSTRRSRGCRTAKAITVGEAIVGLWTAAQPTRSDVLRPCSRMHGPCYSCVIVFGLIGKMPTR